MADSSQSFPHKRLMDYLVVVGARKPTLDSTETPELLRRFPQKDHEDSSLPPDVVFFCQPEGCSTVSKKFSLREANSFIFTLTDKDTNKVRYGVCMNIYRPCSQFLFKENTETKAKEINITKRRRSRSRNKKEICMTLTSICIVSHNPFFSTFRECLFVLRKMVDSRVGQASIDKNENCIPGLDSWSVFTCTEDPKLSPLADEMKEIETWVHRLLLAPAPVPSRTRVNIDLLCPETYPSLVFSTPDNSRFPLIDFPVHIPLELLGVETCLKVLTCILLEQKVVIQSRDYNALTMTVLALTSLVYPLQYMFPIIPLLPTCMNNAEQLLMAPTPYVIGVPASFFRYKENGFTIPNDIWVVDLDSNKLTVPLSADELPDLPQDVGPILVKQLKMALQALSMPPQSIATLKNAAPHDRIPQVVKGDKPAPNSPIENLVFGNDVDAVDVAVRVALVNFFLSDDVLGGVNEHVRTLRLFPRPVVALQKGPFMKSRPKQSDFVLALSETQAVEYFGEWFICPTNTAFQKIQKGIYDPQIIGDKAKWYFSNLETVYYQVYDVDSKLYSDPWIEVDYEPSLIFDEEDTPNNEEDDDSSSCYSSVSDLVQQMISGDINGRTPTGSQQPPFNPMRSSSPLPDVQASFSLPDALTTGPFGQFLGIPRMVKERQTSDSDTIVKSSSDTMPSGDSQTNSIENESYSAQDEDSDDFMYSVSNPPSPEGDRKKGPTSDTDESEKTATSDQDNSQSSVVSKVESSSTETLSVMAGFLNSLNSLKKSTINVAKMATQEPEETKNSDGLVKRTNSQTSLNSLSSKSSMASEDKSFFPFPGMRQRNGSTDKIHGRPSLVKQASLERAAQSENQQFLKEILRNVMRGDGVGWLTSKRLKRLMTEESYRLQVVNQLYSTPVATEDETGGTDDVPLYYDKSLTLTANLNNNAKALESLQQKIPALQWNLSSLSFGTWLSSSTPTTTSTATTTAGASPTGTGSDSTQFLTPVAKRISQSVYKGVLELLRYMILGFEVAVSNHGIGGVASAFKFLEIAHTHYHGRDIKEEAMKRRSEDEFSITSHRESISSLSDQLSEVSFNLEMEKRRLNGESDRDSGHGGSEFDAIMLPVTDKHQRRSKATSYPRWNSDLTNSFSSSKSKARLRENNRLIRAYSADQPSKTAIQREAELKKERSKSPTLAHMKLSEGGSSRRNSYDRLSISSVNIPPSPVLRKSNLNKGYRYFNGDLYPIDKDPDKPTTGRKYLFESLLHERSPLWDNMDFWENIFLDAVAAEREAIGMAQGTIEMIERHKSLQKQEQKRLEEEEDRLLATILYNLVAFMIALDVDKTAIKKKIRRLIGKAHIGLVQGQPINDLLDNIENLNGNDVDLKPTGSRQIKKQSFVVHSGSTMHGDVFFMEVSDDCILLRTGAGIIVERWWYENMVNITYCNKTKVICLWYRKGNDTLLSKFCTKKCKALYYCVKGTMQRAADRMQASNKGPQLGGNFPIQDMDTNEKGQLQVTLEGIGLKFSTKRIHIDLCHIRNCSTQKGIFNLDEFVPATQQTVEHRFKSEKCNEICYAVLCLFSYVAASRTTDNNSGIPNKSL